MATTLNIQRFIRSVRQGRTSAPVSCTAMAACTHQAFDALVAASWTRVEEKEAGLPRHNWAQTGFSNRWDAAKYCGDYAEGSQHGYATAVCYTLRMPANALAGTVAKITSLAIPVRGDRWLADGCGIGVTLSASATPPAWDAAPGDSVTGQLAVVPSNTGTDSAETITFDWSAAPKTALAYLHIVLRLTDYLTHRGAWIEGGAMIDGANIAVAFNRNVVPDAETTFDALPTRTIAFRSLQETGGTLHFGGEYGLAWYTSTVASLFSRTTKLYREMSIKQALAQFPYAAKTTATEWPTAPSGAGIKYIEAGGVDNVRVDGAVMALYYHAQQPRSVSRFTILLGMPGSAIPSWHNGLHIRWAVYHIPGAWESDALSPASLQNPLFWRGTATSVVFLTTAEDRAVAAVPVASFIMPDGGYANGDTIPILLTTLASRGTFLMAWHPEDVTDHDIPAAMDTFYGINFTVSIPEAMFLE